MTTAVLDGVAPSGRFWSFTLWRRTGKPRLRLLEVGRFWDGWLAVRGQLRAWPSSAGAISFTLSLPAHHAPVTVAFGTRTYQVRSGKRTHVRLPVPPAAAPWRMSFRVRNGASVRPDRRMVSVRSSVPVLVSRP